MGNVMNLGALRARETVNVKVQSSLSGNTYAGAFTWRRMKLTDYGDISAVESDLTGGKAIVDTQILGRLINSIATLSVVVEKYPEWWEEIKDIPDASVIVAVHRKYLEWLSAPFRPEGEATAESPEHFESGTE